MSANIVMEEESIEELNKMIESAEHYKTPEGDLVYSASNDISDLVLKMFTED